MATATNGTTASAISNGISKLQHSLYGSRGLARPKGIKTLKQTIALVAGDLALDTKTTILTFPAIDGQLLHLRFKITDVDTNGAPTLKSDIILDDSSGSTIVTLISQSTKGQAGGSDELDADLDPTLLNVNGLVLKHKAQTAAATGASGTLTVYATVNYDLVSTF